MKDNLDFYGRSTILGIITLFVYYFIIFIISLLITIYILMINNNSSLTGISLLYNKDPFTNELNKYNTALIGSLGSALLGNSIYYIRKLYKLSLGKRFLMDIKTNQDKLENIGTMFYFILRPFFAMSFSILMVIGIKSGLFILSGNSNSSTSTFVEVTMFFSFFTGFSTGKFLKSLEDKSDKFIETILKDNKA